MNNETKGNFQISPRILDHLGVAAYSSLKKCLAELCSNSYDADAGKIEITIPKRITKKSEIIISDTGDGMSVKDIKERYLFIGYNRRKIKGEKTKKGRFVIGNKGIRKLAGFGIANEIQIITVKNKIENRFTLKRNQFDDLTSLNKIDIKIISSKTNEKNGTKLILKKLSESIKINQESLRRHLYKSLPNIPKFQVFVNEIKCSTEDIPGEKVNFSHKFDGIGKITGFYIIAKSRQKPPGLIIRVRKRAVTEPSLFGLEKRSHFSFTTDKIAGEVNADFLDRYINTSRDAFIEDVEEVEIFEEYLHDFFKDIIDEIERKADKKRTRELLDKSDIKKKLEKLPPHIRSRARKAIEGVLSKLSNVSDDEIDELVDWIIRYFESNVMRELMNAINNADEEDIEKLSSLIQDWGLKQMNDITVLIKDQIEIIQQLEKLIASNKSLEIDLHKLIEKNLWLIREGLELWKSDKPLKDLLDGQIDKTYKEYENLRPDIVCRSRDNGKKAVILEFKRPKEKIKIDHINQAIRYKALIKRHRPSIEIETFVIGREYTSDVLLQKTDFEGMGLYLWGFQEILQRTRGRFEKILEILEEK